MDDGVLEKIAARRNAHSGKLSDWSKRTGKDSSSFRHGETDYSTCFLV
jgi:hypothetical protein